MPEPRVSCVIPAWNAASTIERSIASALAQTRPPDEIVVVDDGSTDDTAAVASRHPAVTRVVQQTNAGADAARNRGVAESTGTIIAMLDSDDIWRPRKLERQLAALGAPPEPDIVGCLFDHIGDPTDPGVAIQLARYGNRPVPGWSGSDLCFRRRVFDEVGPLDARLRHAAITEWLVRCEAAGLRRHLVPEALVVRTLRPGSASTVKVADGSSESLQEYLQLAHSRILAARARRSAPGSS